MSDSSYIFTFDVEQTGTITQRLGNCGLVSLPTRSFHRVKKMLHVSTAQTTFSPQVDGVKMECRLRNLHGVILTFLLKLINMDQI